MVLACMALARAAGAEPLTLTDAVRTALAHSPMMEESRANATTARAGRTQVRGMGLPALEIRELALRTDSPADAFGLQLMQERFSFPEFTQSDPNAPAPHQQLRHRVPGHDAALHGWQAERRAAAGPGRWCTPRMP